MSRDSEYHARPEWSYSDFKTILTDDIDTAVAKKMGLIPGPENKSIDLGSLAHMIILGGEDCYALKEDSGYKTFQSNAAKAWKAEQEAQGKTIIDRNQWKAVEEMVWNVQHNANYSKYLGGDGWEHEKEIYATLNGVKCKGKADGLKIVEHENGMKSAVIADLKTTNYFQDFFRKAYYNHYDLQAAVYSHITAAALGVSSSLINYVFCVVETKPPYHSAFYTCNNEFIESGERRLDYCLAQVKKFGDKEPNFMIEEVKELGDFSEERIF